MIPAVLFFAFVAGLALGWYSRGESNRMDQRIDDAEQKALLDASRATAKFWHAACVAEVQRCAQLRAELKELRR